MQRFFHHRPGRAFSSRLKNKDGTLLTMRLIDTQTLELKDFFSSEVPKYAILSHTWENDEISLQEMKSQSRSTLEELAGYAKIQNCCAIALKWGYKYAWVRESYWKYPHQLRCL
jgi:hypothetical protein